MGNHFGWSEVDAPVGIVGNDLHRLTVRVYSKACGFHARPGGGQSVGASPEHSIQPTCRAQIDIIETELPILLTSSCDLTCWTVHMRRGCETML